MAAVGFELTTRGFRGMVPTHCAIGADFAADENIVIPHYTILVQYYIKHKHLVMY